VAKPRALVAWSSGKDSAFALYEALRAGEYEIAGILTTLTSHFDRVSIHGVRTALLRRQAQALALRSIEVEIPYPCPNEAYEAAMERAMLGAQREGVTHVIFGDLFLSDIRAYREKQLAKLGLTPVFPLWMRETRALAAAMFDAGIRARVVAVDTRRLPKSFAGRRFDQEFVRDLPAGVDPCGENGEFHTFVTGAPMFASPIGVAAGEVVERDGAYYADLLPA
jgi:uncharacterized protein (TIGR00290 family)